MSFRSSVLQQVSSHMAVGAVLQQLNDDRLQPLCFFSMKLLPAQQNYCDRELLAICEVIKYFRHMVEGRMLTIETDHNHLYLLFVKNLIKLQPQAIEVSQFYLSVFNGHRPRLW